MELISLKADFAAKELFAHEKVRKQFLSDTLGIPPEDIKSVRLVNPFLRRRYKRQKQGILDVVLELNDNAKIDIEMQVRRQKHWTRRNLYYLAGMYTDGLMLGERYEKLPRCISISLLDYDFFPGREEYHSIYRLRDSEGKDLTDLWELHIIELTKALKGTPVDDWIRLFNAEREEELDMIMTKNEGITEAINVLKSMSLRRPLKALFEDYMKAKRDRWDEDEYIRDEGRSEGIAIGKSEGIAIGEERGITIGEARGRSTDILTLLEQKGTVPADLRERILSQKDEAVLKQWLLAAASAEDIKAFCEKIGIS